MNKQKESHEAIQAEITAIQDNKIAAFEAEQLSYHNNMYPEADTREAEARRMDTNFNRKRTDSRLEFAVPNWNDALSDADMWEKCSEIRDILSPIAEQTHSHAHFLRGIRYLLNNSFSETIKQHIVSLTASTETVEGACRDCFELYDRESSEIDVGMRVWFTLSDMLHTASVYEAFLERAWHLNPSSQHFPKRYKDLVKAIRQQERESQLRKSVYYADPYNQMSELNETAKQIRYALRHTNDPKEIAKLSAAQVKVLGALFVINERLDRQHQKAIAEAKEAKALPVPENPREEITESPKDPQAQELCSEDA